MDDFVKSYLHSQKLVGADKIAIPNKYSTENDWKKIYRQLGTPETGDGYKYKLPEDHQIEDDTLKSFSNEAVKLGLLPNQANGVMNYYNEIIKQGLSDQAAHQKTAQDEAVVELRKEFGASYQKEIQSAKNLVHATLGKEFIDNALLQDGSRLGDNPTVIKAFAKLANKLSEDDIVKGDVPSYLTTSEINKQISALQQPGSAYWDKNHISHADSVAEVQALLRKKNNEEDA